MCEVSKNVRSGLVLVQEPWTYATKLEVRYEDGISFKELKRVIVLGRAFMILLIFVVV